MTRVLQAGSSQAISPSLLSPRIEGHLPRVARTVPWEERPCKLIICHLVQDLEIWDCRHAGVKASSATPLLSQFLRLRHHDSR